MKLLSSSALCVTTALLTTAGGFAATQIIDLSAGAYDQVGGATNNPRLLSNSSSNGGVFSGSRIHGRYFEQGNNQTQIYSGLISGQRDTGIEIYGRATTYAATGRVDANGDPIGFTNGNLPTNGTGLGPVVRAVIYDTEVAATNSVNGADRDLQRVDRDSNNAIVRSTWGDAGGTDRGNLGDFNPSHVENGALIIDNLVNPADANNDFFIDGNPNDRAGEVINTLVFDVVDNRANALNYRYFAFDFVDLDEGADSNSLIVTAYTTGGGFGRWNRAALSNGIPGEDLGGEDGSISRIEDLDVRMPDIGDPNDGFFGSGNRSGGITRIEVTYQGVSGAVGSLTISDSPIPFEIPEPSAVLPLIGLLGVSFLRRRR